jgi:S-DNA-T family DNA segregation ATPase FtsK/SpoIIIE
LRRARRCRRWLRLRWASRKDVAEGRERRLARKEAVETEQKKSATRAPPRIEPPLPGVERSARVERERQVPLFDPPKANELPPLKLLDDPPGAARGGRPACPA